MPGTCNENLVPAAGVVESLKPLFIVIVRVLVLITHAGADGKLVNPLHWD